METRGRGKRRYMCKDQHIGGQCVVCSLFLLQTKINAFLTRNFPSIPSVGYDVDGAQLLAMIFASSTPLQEEMVDILTPHILWHMIPTFESPDRTLILTEGVVKKALILLFELFLTRDKQ